MRLLEDRTIKIHVKTAQFVKNCVNRMKIDDFRDKFKSHNYTRIQYIYVHHGGVLTGARTCLLEIPISKSNAITITPHKYVIMCEKNKFIYTTQYVPYNDERKRGQ